VRKKEKKRRGRKRKRGGGRCCLICLATLSIFPESSKFPYEERKKGRRERGIPGQNVPVLNAFTQCRLIPREGGKRRGGGKEGGRGHVFYFACHLRSGTRLIGRRPPLPDGSLRRGKSKKKKQKTNKKKLFGKTKIKIPPAPPNIHPPLPPSQKRVGESVNKPSCLGGGGKKKNPPWIEGRGQVKKTPPPPRPPNLRPGPPLIGRKKKPLWGVTGGVPSPARVPSPKR